MTRYARHRIALSLVSALVFVGPPGASASVHADPLIISGTSEVTYTGASTLGPSIPMLDDVRFTSRWATDGQGNLRVDRQTIKPALTSGTDTTALANPTITEYSDLYNRSLQEPLPAPLGDEGQWGLLGLLTGGSTVSTVQRLDSGFVNWANQQGEHAVVLRQGSAGGRPATVIQLSPLYKGQDSSGKTTSTGKATIWLDVQYPIVLKLEMSDLGPNNPQHWSYRVTSLTVGELPEPGFLQYQPPVTPTDIALPGTSASTLLPVTPADTGNGVPAHALNGPKGFIPVTVPARYWLRNEYESTDPLWGKTSGIGAIFKGNGYIAVQEQVRVNGLPAELKSGSSHRAGTCRVWTGASVGAHWLALQRKKVSLLAVSDTLSQKALIHFATKDICP